MTQTDRDTPVTALQEALASWDAIEGSGLTDQLRAFIAAGKMADAIRAALASSDDVAGSGERLRLDRIRLALEAIGVEGVTQGGVPVERAFALTYMAADPEFRLHAVPTTEAPPKDAPKRQRIDWSNVVVDEGDEAP